MKQWLVALTVASVVALGLFPGCSKDKAAPAPQEATPAKAPVAPEFKSGPAEAPAPAPAPAPAETPAAAKVVGWRGDGSGVYPDAEPTAAWDSDENKGFLWKVAVGSSYSQPVVAGNRVLVTSEPDKLVCVGIKEQKVLWEKSFVFDDLLKELKAEGHPWPTSCGFTSPTPVTDGKNVWASFGTGIVVCCDLDGNRKWAVFLNNPPQTEYGRTAAPVLVDGKLVVTVGFLVALDPATGKTLWKAEDASEAYGTPAVAKIGDTTVLVTATGDVVRVSDGEIVVRGLATLSYDSPITQGDVVFFMGARSTAFKLSVNAGKFDAKKIWQTDLESDLYASPVIHDGIVYGATNDGFLFALDAVKGDILYKQQLDMASAAAMPGMPPGNLYPSLAIAGGKLFVGNDKGQTIVVQPGKEFKQLSKNLVEEGAGSNPEFAGKLLFLRGGENLYCIGSK